MTCKKCSLPSSVILRKKDQYCDDCFLANTNHKFRACIGKNKILSSNEKVLLCLSGGKKSTVMLNFVHYGINLDIHKKLRIDPVFLHIISDSQSIPKILLEQCEKYNLNIYFVHLSDYMQENIVLPNINCVPLTNNASDKEFQDMLASMPPTARNDFLQKTKRTLFIRYANLLKCNFIFTAETTTTLAINLLSSLAIGRGSQVDNDIGFMDIRDENIKILRPMKDISPEDIDYYISIKNLSPADDNEYSNIASNSLQSVITEFVTDMQNNSQSTVSTICKTADKLGVTEAGHLNHMKCVLCESKLCNKMSTLSAFEATNFSRAVSLGNMQHDENFKNILLDIEKLQINQHTNKTMFPLFDKRLCYSCSRHYFEMGLHKLPLHIEKLLNKQN